MILLYHNIKLKNENKQTINIYNFTKHMFSLQDKTVVYLEDYDASNPNHVVITFDDGYKEILYYALPILRHFKYPFEVFVVGKFYEYAQEGNTAFLDREDLKEIIKAGGRLQYHTKTHPHLEEISNEQELIEEIIVPDEIKSLDSNGFNYFAYPCCTYSPKVIEIVKKHYKGARSGKGLGNDNPYCMESLYMMNETEIPTNIIISRKYIEKLCKKVKNPLIKKRLLYKIFYKLSLENQLKKLVEFYTTITNIRK